MSTFKAIELFPNSKNPIKSWRDVDNFIDLDIDDYIKNRTSKCGKNYSLLTGKTNNLSIVDIDFKTPEEYDKHPFLKDFGADPKKWAERWGCPIVQTPSGGFHLYFNYDERIPTCASKTKKNCEWVNTDLRGNSAKSPDGGLIISAGVIRDGKTYKMIEGHVNNRPSFPEELYDWCREVNLIGKTNNKKEQLVRIKKIKNGNKHIIIEEVLGCDQSLYCYDFPDDLLHKIIKGLDKEEYFHTYQGYLLFTTAMKQIDRQDIWEEYPKLNNPVDGDVHSEGHKIWMLNCWDGITSGHKTYYAINKLLNETKYEQARTCLEYYKYKPLLENKRVPDKIINSKKLGYHFFTYLIDEFPEKKYFVIKSDTGTGKTTSFKHYAKSFRINIRKFISIVSRISLGLEQYSCFNEFGLDTLYYEDNSYNPDENYVVQIDSLMKLKWMSDQGWTDGCVLFLDEFNSITKHLLTSDTLSQKGTRIPIMDLLIDLIKYAKYVICTDADISDPAIQFLDFCDSEKVCYVKNEYQHNKDKPAEELYNIEKMVEMMKAQPKWICPCDEARSCHLLKEMIGDPNIIVIDSKCNVRYDWDEHDRIIFSPKVIYGLDSVMERPVFCFYQESTIDAGDMLQQINRNRNITKLYYLFQRKKSKNSVFNTLQDCIEDTEDIQKWCEKNDYLHQEISRVHPLFKKIFNQYKYNKDCYNSNPFGHFIRLLDERGFKNKILPLQSNKRTTKELLKEDKARMIASVHKDLEYVKAKNEYIGLPEDQIENHKTIFCDNQFITRFTFLRKYIFENYEESFDPEKQRWENYIEDETERYVSHFENMKEELKLKDEFNIKKIKSGKNKLIYIEKVRNMLGLKDRLTINGFNVLDKAVADELYAEYKCVFTDRSKVKGNPFYTHLGTQQHISKMYKNVFGISPFDPFDTTKNGKKHRGYNDAELKDFNDKEKHIAYYTIFKKARKQYEIKKIQEHEVEQMDWVSDEE